MSLCFKPPTASQLNYRITQSPHHDHMTWPSHPPPSVNPSPSRHNGQCLNMLTTLLPQDFCIYCFLYLAPCSPRPGTVKHFKARKLRLPRPHSLLQLPNCAIVVRKQSEAICKQVSMAVFQYYFIYKSKWQVRFGPWAVVCQPQL